jgi:hypothetical protein
MAALLSATLILITTFIGTAGVITGPGDLMILSTILSLTHGIAVLGDHHGDGVLMQAGDGMQAGAETVGGGIMLVDQDGVTTIMLTGLVITMDISMVPMTPVSEEIEFMPVAEVVLEEVALTTYIQMVLPVDARPIVITELDVIKLRLVAEIAQR